MKQIKLTISGKVQGVFYRAETQGQAQQLSLTGFAQNNSDGTVTVVAQGEQPALEKLITWCHHGPESAKVQEVKIEWQEATSSYPGFEIY